MVTNKDWIKEVLMTYNKMWAHKEKYSVDIDGKEIIVWPKVFSPAYFSDSEFFAKEVARIVREFDVYNILDIGTGTGIIPIFAAEQGAFGTGIDINPYSVWNARENFYNHSSNVSLNSYWGDVYDVLSGNKKYDLIFSNHPNNNSRIPIVNPLLKAGFDHNYGTLEKFIEGGRDHLNQGGFLLLGTSDKADIVEINKIAEKHGYELDLISSKRMKVGSQSDMYVEYRIYELVDHNWKFDLNKMSIQKW